MIRLYPSATECLHITQGVALAGRNTTGPPRSVGRPTVRAPVGRPARRQRYRRLVGWLEFNGAFNTM